MPSSDPEIQDALAMIAQAHALLDDAEARLTGRPVQHAAKGLPAPADDADLDGQYGNPVVHKDPPKWTGQTYAGAPFSDCPPDYLRILADLLVWRAGKADEEGRTTKGGKPQSEFLRKDAARALGWMQRKTKNAQSTKGKPTSLNDPDDSEVPF